jgi:hypothetical protein
MNSSGLPDLSYLSMCPVLNFSSQTTYLSDGARAWKPPLPVGVTSLTGEHHGRVDNLALETPPIINDVAEVFVVLTALSQVAILSNPPTRIIVG